MYIIGIDIGTTSICGVKLDARTGKVLRTESVSSNAFIPGCASWEKIQSPETLLALATGILESFICDQTAAIGVTGQMHGIVYVNRDGRAVSPLYTWQDTRGNLPYRDSTYAKHLGSCAGYGNVTDFYNRDNGLRPKEAVSYCTIQDYFVMRLCGLQTPLMHASNAASFGLYDLLENRFDWEVGADVTADYKIAGTFRGIPVAVAIGDNQASVFSTLRDSADALCNVGTGSQISIVSDKIIWHDNIETRPYFGGRYLTVGSALCGGRAYSLLKSFYAQLLRCAGDFTDEQVYALMDTLLAKQDIGLTVDTRFAGTRADTQITGSIRGITPENFTPGALTYGVLEGMFEELYGMYLQMGCRRTGLVGSGNGVRKNPHFVKLAQERFGAKMKIPVHLEEAAFGAALFGGVAAGVFQSSTQAQQLIRYL